MIKNKSIPFIIFLWVIIISYSFIFSDSERLSITGLILEAFLFLTLLFLLFFTLLKIGNFLFRMIFRKARLYDLKDKIFISGVVFASSFLMFVLLVPKLLNVDSMGKETAAIQALQEIHRSEAAFYSNKKRFANLDELVDAGLLGKNYRENQVVSGYRFSTTDVTKQTFCIHADRAKKSSGNGDLNIAEDGEVRVINAETIGTVARGKGRLLTDEVE
jgi:hypothetical protein